MPILTQKEIFNRAKIINWPHREVNVVRETWKPPQLENRKEPQQSGQAEKGKYLLFIHSHIGERTSPLERLNWCWNGLWTKTTTINTNSHISVVLNWEAHLFIKVSVLLGMVGRCLASSTVLNIFFWNHCAGALSCLRFKSYFGSREINILHGCIRHQSGFSLAKLGPE